MGIRWNGGEERQETKEMSASPPFHCRLPASGHPKLRKERCRALSEVLSAFICTGQNVFIISLIMRVQW